MTTIAADDRGALNLAIGRNADDASALPPWLNMPLIASAPARAKLLDWVRSAQAPRICSVTDVLLKLQAFGDAALALAIAEVLAVLPPPVTDYAVTRVTFVTVGRQLLGWCGPRIDDGDRPWLVALGPCSNDGTKLNEVTAHEVAHAWLLEERPSDRMCAAVVAEAVNCGSISLAPPAIVPMLHAERAAYACYEREAEALVEAWGFSCGVRA